MKDQFNRLQTDSQGLIRNFVILTSGTVVKYAEEKNDGKSYTFKNGRVVTEAAPNGLAFTSCNIEKADIIVWGELLHPENDVRELEEIADNADTNP